MSYGGDYRVSVWDRYGVYLTELECDFNCVWSLNEIGNANFKLSRHDPKCRRKYLQYGNYVLFEHARLGSWGGLILPHDGRDWGGDGYLTTRARSAEFNFWRRRAPLIDGGELGSWDGTPGELFERIINRMNLKQDTRVRPGDIRQGGRSLAIWLRLKMWNTAIEKIVKRTKRREGGDYWLEPARDANNRLIFRANFVLNRGEESIYHLHEDINLETPGGQFYREDGELMNDVAVLSSASDGTNYQTGYATDEESFARYGLFEGSATLTSDVEGAAQIEAESLVDKNAWPRNASILNAIETLESPDTFARIHVGDVVSVHLYSVGFYYDQIGVDLQVRITSIEYDSEPNTAMLTVEEVKDAGR